MREGGIGEGLKDEENGLDLVSGGGKERRDEGRWEAGEGTGRTGEAGWWCGGVSCRVVWCDEMWCAVVVVVCGEEKGQVVCFAFLCLFFCFSLVW